MRYKDIVKVDEKGLKYKDNDHIEKFVDFETCKSSFVRYMAEQYKLSSEEEQDLQQRSKTVACRDASAKPMYFEFFSNPRIRVDFPRTLYCLNPYSNFSKLQHAIINAGWTTFDLS